MGDNVKKIIYITVLFAVSSFAFLIIKYPEICATGTARGIIICGKTLIPSLFPFTFCVLFVQKSGIFSKLKIQRNIFGLDSEMLSVFLFSLVGGYPLGAKMLSCHKERTETADMLNFCVNAGPAFIIVSVGNGIFHSAKIGILLFAAHILPSVFLAFLFGKSKKAATKKSKPVFPDIIDNFVISATESSSALLNICGYVILFSVITEYLHKFDERISFLKFFSAFLEITNGINSINNIYIISALLGFGGICIWCQVFSLAKNIKINYKKFVICRIFHSLSSVVTLFSFVKIFKITLPTAATVGEFIYYPFENSPYVGISLIITGIILIISLCRKNYVGNILEDIV